MLNLGPRSCHVAFLGSSIASNSKHGTTYAPLLSLLITDSEGDIPLSSIRAAALKVNQIRQMHQRAKATCPSTGRSFGSA